MSFKEGKQKVSLMIQLNESQIKFQGIMADISDLQDIIMAYETKERRPLPFVTSRVAVSAPGIVRLYNGVCSRLSHEMNELCGRYDHSSDKSADDTLFDKLSAIDKEVAESFSRNTKYRGLFDKFMNAGLNERPFGSLTELDSALNRLETEGKKLTTKETDEIIQTVKKDLILVTKPLARETTRALRCTLESKQIPRTSVKDLFKEQPYFYIANNHRLM